MSHKRRKLTTEEIEAAQNLRGIWEAKQKERIERGQPKLTQEFAAYEFGITQGQVAKYLNGLIPLNTDMLLKFSELLDVEPTDIMPSFLRGQYKFKATRILDEAEQYGLNRTILNNALAAARQINEERNLRLSNHLIDNYAMSAYEKLAPISNEVTENITYLVLSLLMPKNK